jgi:hypothetical protein
MSARKVKARRSKRSPSTRARVKPAAPPEEPSTVPATRRARVLFIARQMAAGAWRKGRDRGLAKVWGLDGRTVRSYSAEASRVVELATGDREHLLRLVRLRLAEIIESDTQDPVPAMRVLLEHLGELRQRQEISGPGGRPIETKGSTQLVILPAKDERDDDAEGNSEHGGNGASPDEH